MNSRLPSLIAGVLSLCFLPAAQPAHAQGDINTYLSKHMAVDLPPKCFVSLKKYLKRADYFAPDVFVSNSADSSKIQTLRRHGGDVEKTKVMIIESGFNGFENIDLMFKIVKKECADRLVENAKRIETERTLENEWQKQGFKYVASTKRPYCGTAVVEAKCDYQVPAHIEPLYNIVTDAKKPFVKAVFSKLDEARNIDFFENIFYVAEPGAEAEFESKSQTPAGTRLYFYFFSNDDDHQLILKFAPLYVTNSERGSLPDEASYNSKVEQERLLGIFLKSSSPHRGSLDEKSPLISYTYARAKGLLDYWKDRENFFERLSQLGDQALTLDYFDFSKNTTSMKVEDFRKATDLPLIQRISKTALSVATDALSRTNNSERLTEAASLWWAGRALQIQVGCNEEQNIPFYGLDSLVRDQYMHQTCRRHYTNKAYTFLNATLAKGNEFSITTPAFLTTYVLGSRKERLSLFSKAFTWYSQQVKSGTLPSKGEMSFLVREVFQTIAEVDEKKVLTWNGPQPADSADLEEMNQFLSSSKDFFEELKGIAKANRWKNADHYKVMRDIWRQIGARLGLSRWGDEEPGTAPNVAVQAITKHFVKSPVIESFQKELDKLDLSTTDGLNRLIDLMDVAGDTIDKAPSFGPEMCRNLYEKAFAHPGRPNLMRSPGFEAHYSNCIGTLKAWLSSDPQMESIDRLCRKGQGLACLAAHELDPSLVEKLSPADWTLLFTRNPLPTFVLKGLQRITKTRLNDGLADKKLGAKWRAAQAEVLDNLRKNWVKLLRSSSTAALAEAYMYGRLPNSSWKNNIFDALDNYIYWIQVNEPSSLQLLKKKGTRLGIRDAVDADSTLTTTAYTAVTPQKFRDAGFSEDFIEKSFNKKYDLSIDLARHLNALYSCIYDCEEKPSTASCSCRK